MTDYGLSPQQLAVICALSSGATLTAAAEQAGLHRNTIANWRRNSPPFQVGLAHAQYDRAMYFREKAEDLVDLAIAAIQEILTNPKTPPSVRLKAALAIVATASTPPLPKKQVELDIEKHYVKPSEPQPAPVHNDAQPSQPPAQTDSPSPEASPVHSDAQPPAPFQRRPVHNPAQAPYRRENPKVGRNETCPCGSGKKYKRCCLNMKVSRDFVQRLASAA